MFSEQITNACARFPANNKERFLIYPALAIYSPIEDSVKTVVGGAFTALSLISVGLCPPINNVANWTRHSRGILTVPSQIIGNIFELNSKILMDYNIIAPAQCALGQITTPVILQGNVQEILTQIETEFAAIDISALSDVLLRKAQSVCTNLFQKRTETKVQLIAKHVIFRVYSLINAIACTALLGIMALLTSIVFIPVALYHRGQKAQYNDFALMILKIPQLIHSVCLTLRMIANPLQFTKQSSGVPELDTNPIMNALEAPGIFWKNMLEVKAN